jgi:hypothetical protein
MELDFISTEPDIPVRIRLEETGPGSVEPTTVIKRFKDTVNKYTSRTALCYQLPTENNVSRI